MNFTCNECNDSGSRDKLGTYLDCNACGTASMRRDLNDFVKSLGPTHPEDVALAIHQWALAMAPKQEADHINDVVKMVGPGGWKLVPVEPTDAMAVAAIKVTLGNPAVNGVDQYRAMLGAAGPDAVLVKALESALAIINNEADQDEYAAPLKIIRAVLSGAKGN